jgi:hypothetical protein
MIKLFGIIYTVSGVFPIIFTGVTLIVVLRLIYIGKFCVQFCIKLARFVKKNFITKCTSLVQNRPRNRANVNDPLIMSKKSFITLGPGG